MGFLISEPKHTNCSQLANTLNLSHDSINRFLLRENYEPLDLYTESMSYIDLIGGTLSVDDTMLDKPYATSKMRHIGYYWSGKHHRTVQGINLLTLYYTDRHGRSAPINYRIYKKEENKTKNDYFLDMLAQVLTWGLKPHMVMADSWYSCVKNLKAVKNHGMGFQFAIECNRTVSVEKGTWIQVQSLPILPEGSVVWLKDFGKVKLFRTRLEDQARHYVTHRPEEDDYDGFTQEDFQHVRDLHWEIEQYHRSIKQICNIERFQVRTGVAIMNHIFASLCCFVQLQKMTATALIANAYRLKRELYMEIVAAFITSFVPSAQHLNAKFKGAVNA